MKKQINHEYINELYMAWLNERDPFMQRKRKEEVRNKISPYELLLYSEKYSFPFNIFRNIFSLNDLFETLKEMQRQGEDIKRFVSQSLVIDMPEEIKTVSDFSNREVPSEINSFCLIFKGSNVFKYGDIKNIGKNFPKAYANNLDIEQIEQMTKSQRDFKGIPITITIDNIGELPLEKLTNIEKCFDIEGIKIVAKNRSIHNSHQGECTPLNLRTYKQIRKVVDDEIISKLYVDENANQVHTDYQLATQIIDILANRIKHDLEAEKKSRFSEESIMASGLVGLLTKKSICKGYSEILRNVLSCVNIESTVIDGIAFGGDHSWNQVKLGDDIWTNVDLTEAEQYICTDRPSGDLFMSDIAFFGDRRKETFEEGKEVNGKSMEATCMHGGHLKAYGTNSRQCISYITPALTLNLIQKSRLYAETYNKDGKSTDYKGPVPYVGSNVEKMRSNSMAFVGSGR